MRTMTQSERATVSEARLVLLALGYKTAANWVDDALCLDSEERMAKDSDRIEDEGE